MEILKNTDKEDTLKFAKEHGLPVVVADEPVDIIVNIHTGHKLAVVAISRKFKEKSELLNFIKPNMYVYVIKELAYIDQQDPLSKNTAWILRSFNYPNDNPVIIEDGIITAKRNPKAYAEFEESNADFDELENMIPLTDVIK